MYNKKMDKKLIKYLFESFLIIIVLPYIAVCCAASYTVLGLAIIFFMAILPAYFIFSPLRFSTKTAFIWLVPIYNAFLFLLSIKITFNNSAQSYLIAYIPLAYLAILIKLAYQHYKDK